ncbi:hypothetical protein DL764_005369 [Monosporascus ibericus]|uniref:Carrier domain-containing protein n=1 Tax=Monosporascus ibericus TaxID=155417 RepID=A0A4Q4T9I3_9PEZI|nr:hypothetical protein DL764_005369 [Monosporascus ibericus]
MLTEPVVREFGGDASQESILWGMYGPTEATIHCTLQPEFQKETTRTCIGAPLDTVSAFVLEYSEEDNTDAPLIVAPLGHVGELAIGGFQLAAGYINQPEQTSAAFIETSWGRLYRTGDKARMHPDGTLECLGRINDAQVKLNGQRIELGEVEQVILRARGCHSAFATVISNVLVAFAAVEDAKGIREQILANCKSWLPAFMIPAEIIIMRDFPQLPSGKIDRKRLIADHEASMAVDGNLEEQFSSDLERQLCEAGREILGSLLTPSTRLFSAGLDSLMAIKYASILRELGIFVNLVDILESPTIRDLCSMIQSRISKGQFAGSEGSLSDGYLGSTETESSRWLAALGPLAEQAERVEHCTALQTSMITETLKDHRLYVNQVELEFPQRVNAESIKIWIACIAQRNEVLRTGFLHIDNTLRRVIWKHLGDQIRIVEQFNHFNSYDAEQFLQHPLEVEIRGPTGQEATYRARFTLHHSIYDGWTMDLLAEDLRLLSLGQEPVQRPQFRTASRHLRAKSDRDLMSSKEFWAEYLRGSTPISIPNFKTTAVLHPQIVTEVNNIQIDPAEVRQWTLQSSFSPQVVFQACLGWLWAAITGSDDVILGSVSSGRTLPIAGIENIMGPFIDTLPLRISLSKYQTIGELFQTIHTANRESLRHGRLPLPDVKRAAGLSPASRLFDVIFAYQESLVSRRQYPNDIQEVWHKDAVECALLVEILPLGRHYSCQITWHSNIFSPNQIRVFARHLDNLVKFFIRHSDEPLGAIPKSFPTESLSRYNEKPTCIDIRSSLSELVEKTALIHPRKVALLFAQSINASSIEAHDLTYHDLNARANQIARYIQQHDVAPGGIIAIVMEKSPLMYASILAILKTGCAYLPILPTTPVNRIHLIVQQASPRLCLVDDTCPRLSSAVSCTVVNAQHVSLSEYSDSNLVIPGDASRLAYVIYTSGTTGSPKGVSVTNRNILSNIEVLSRIYPHDPSAKMLQACSQAFDVSVFEIFFTWANGLCLCSATNDTLFEDLERAIRTLRVTHLSMTVTVASLVDPRNVPDVKFLVTSGEPMTDEVLGKWADSLYQGYGPSETTNICTVRKVAAGDSPQFLGWSFENTSTFVCYLNTSDLVPLGCMGELCFGGDQVAAGYLMLPEMTAEKFFEHPEYGRLYRSGDLGRMLPDGSLIILGRIDTQVKIRGLRVELQEIQSTVLSTGVVSTCTTLLVTPKGSNTQQLALFYVPVGEASKSFGFLDITDSVKHSNSAIQQALKDALPNYMIPSFAFPVSMLPLTSSGKIDSNCLRSSSAGLPGSFIGLCSSEDDRDGMEDGWTEAETAVAKALVNILDLDQKSIGRWTSFAALGIDSISAMPLARELQSSFKTRVPLSLVIQNPSVGRLAAAIAAKGDCMDERQPSKKDHLLPTELTEIVRKQLRSQGKPIGAVLPCTPLQEAMLASSTSEASVSYCNQMLFRLRIPSRSMLGYWATMIRRHDILRTCFVTTDDLKFPIVQVVFDNYEPTYEVFEASEITLHQEASHHLRSLSTIIDSGEPPISLAVIRIEDSEYLSFVCHHAVYDGISMRNLLSEVEKLAHDQQLSTPLSFEMFLRETLPLPPHVDDFWEQRLQGIRPLHLDQTAVRDDTAPLSLTTRASRQNLTEIEIHLKNLGVSLLSFCQAAWAVILSLLQNDQDVCFGNVVSGRSGALDNIDALVAPCFNTLPIRMDLANSGSTLELIKKFHSLNIEILPYQFTSLRRIQSRLQLPSRLFDTLLILQPPSEPLDETVWTLEVDRGVMDVSRCSCIFRTYSGYSFTAAPPTPSERETPIGTPASSADEDSWSREEMIVRSVLSKLVNVREEKIERHMPIYRFGLDSIGAVQLAASLRRQEHVISAADIMANPTCVGIASCMEDQLEDSEVATYDFEAFRHAVSRDLTSVKGLPEELEAVFPCSPVQQGMLSQFLMSEGKHYFNFSSWTLNVGLDTDDLAQAWEQLVTQHQILRTGFVSVNHSDSSFAMVVYPAGYIAVPVTRNRAESVDIQQWRIESAQAALHTLSQPPWRVLLVDRDAGPSTMHLAMQHALYDAHSLRGLLHDLACLIEGKEVYTYSGIESALSQIIKPMDSQRASEAFWKSQTESLVVNSFPTLTPLHVKKQTFSTVSTACGASLDILRQHAADAGITIHAALQGAWTRLLSAYHGELTVTFGVVLDGRTTEESKQAMFPMISTLPVIAQNSESNSELLHSMLQYNATRRYEHTPLSLIQRWLGRPDCSLFDTILVYQVADRDSHNLPWTILDEAASVDYPVSVEAEETVDKLQFNLSFDTSILPAEQADMILEQLNVIFVDLVTCPDGHSHRLTHQAPKLYSILPPAHPGLPSSAELLHQLVEKTVQSQPDSLALEFVDELTDNINRRRWTYRELNAMGNRVANILHGNHVPPKSIVAICLDKCPEAYFSILGILKAGYSFLALDPSAPSLRQEFILRDSEAACLLIAEAWRSNLGFACPVPILEVGDNALSTVPTTLFSPSPPISPSDTCYCLYTSGTTGTPKGCLISHDNAVQAMQAFKELFSGHWDSQSRWLQFASFHFDVSVLEQYWSWFVGITVVAAPRDLILSDLIKTISKLEITHIDLTPSLARLVHPDEVPSLCRGVFITGGEQLRQDVLDNWGPKEVIYNAYGPTEATIGVTMFQRVPANGRSSNIGHLFPNVGGYVFHPGTEIPVFKGGVGELCVSGRLVGKGYLNRQQLTKERFPVLNQYGDRVYRTGDLVRVLHDDSIDFLGRADDQVKLRGQRLEVGEINQAIKASVSQVADVATLVTRHGSQDRDLLVSFVAPRASPTSSKELHVLSDEASLSIAKEAQDACRERLPGYMVPTYVFTVPSIPLSANNKANLNSLKQLSATLSSEQLRYLSTSATGAHRELSNREHQIASVLSAITRAELSSMQPSSTIFELGIDSITVTRVARNLQTQGFPSATPSLILKNPQISRLAQVLGQEKASTFANQALQVKQSIRARYHKYLGLVCRTLEMTKDSVEYIAPCTPLQEGMLTRSRTTGGHSAYFNDFRISLALSVSVDRVKDAWTRVISSCPILRTAFIQTPEGYVQAALKGEPLRWSILEIQDGAIESCIAARRRTWIELNQDVIRYPLELDYIHSPQERVLMLRLFHAVYDAHSFELILRKVIEEYHETVKGYGPSFLDVLPHGPLLSHSSSRAFWKTVFKNHSFQPLPKLTSTPSTFDTAVSRVIGIDGLEKRRIALGVTHQTIMQASWLVVLQQYFTANPTIGVVFSGRSIVYEGVESVIGPMFNTLPFRVDASDVATWVSFVRKVHEYNTSVVDFVHTPLRDIQKWCSHGRQLFDTLFTFDRADSPEAMESDLWSSISSTAAADYRLALEVALTREQSVKVTLVAQGGIADKEALERLLDQLQHSLASLLASDDDTIMPAKSEANPTNGDVSTVHHRRTGPSQTPSYAQGGTSTFEWTELAKKLRREIALLAGLAEDEVVETASIFELGLDSIDTIKLAARLNNLGHHVTTSDLMKRASIQNILSSQDRTQPQVNGLVAHNDELTRATRELKRYLERLGTNLDDIETVLPPTPLQESMVADMLLSDFYRYFNHDVLRITPGTDMGRLKSAWTTVYDNSPILRTSFEQVEDPKIPLAFCQVVSRNNVEWGPTLELGDLDDVEPIFNHARTKAKNANAKSGLFQVNFVTTPTDKYIVLSISHALYDGWSLDMLYRDVRAAYNGHYETRKPYEPYLSHLLFSSRPASQDFWTDFLHGAHPTLLYTRTAMPEMQNPVVHRAEVVSRFTPMELKILCRTYGITPQVLSQGCWAAVLATLVKALDVTFGIVLSGRDTDEAQELLFPTMNTVPMRIVLYGSVTEYLRSLQATMSEVLEFQHVPLRQAQKLAGVKAQRLFNTLFILQNSAEGPNEDPQIMESVQGTSAVEYPICIEMEVSDASVMWRIACDERFGSSDDARRTLQDLEAVLHYVSKNQDAEVVQFEPHNGRVRVCGQDAFIPKDELQFDGDAPHEAPHDRNKEWSGIDSPVVEVLAQLSGLKKDSINPDDTIYHLGLDSISAMKASSMLRKLGLSVSIRDLLKADSIRQLVNNSAIPEERPKEAPSRTNSPLKDLNLSPLLNGVGIDLNAIEKVLPALPVQVHMLTVWQNTSGLLFYPTFTYKITGCVSPNAAANAWRRLAAELPIFRTHFVATGSVSTPIIQIIAQPERSDEATLGDIEYVGERQWRYQAAVTPFAFMAIEGSEAGEAHISLRIHHALYDGVSLPIIMRRFAELCGTQPLSLPPSSFNAWYELVSDHNSENIKRKAQEFWTSYLEGASSPTLPIDRPGSEKHVVQVAQLKRNAVPDVSRLKRLASTHGVTLQALFFAGYARVLVRRQGQRSIKVDDDVAFGVYLANRTNAPGLEDVPLPTLNILPLRVTSPGSKTIDLLAGEIQKDLLNISAFENSTVGLWEIDQWTGVQIVTFVNFLSFPGDSKNEGKVSVEEVPTDTAPLRVSGDSLPQLACPDAPSLSKNPVRDYYVHAVDIEVAVRGESMDIGVFSSSPSYSQAEASEMVEDIVRVLEEGNALNPGDASEPPPLRFEAKVDEPDYCIKTPHSMSEAKSAEQVIVQ